VAERVEEQNYPRRTDSQNMAGKTAENVRESVELMDQTGEGERLVKTLARMIEEKRVRVRVYTKGRMHANTLYALVKDRPGGRRRHRRLIQMSQWRSQPVMNTANSVTANDARVLLRNTTEGPLVSSAERSMP
jgi:hypothetical protein